MNKYSLGICLGSMLAGLSACQSSPEIVAVRQIGQSPQCGISQPEVKRIDSAAGLQQLAASLRPGLNAVDVSAFNWKTESALLIAWGQQPNPGYRLQLAATEASLENDTLSIALDYLKPEAGRMYPQVMVEPCLVLGVTASRYRFVKMGDEVIELSDD